MEWEKRMGGANSSGQGNRGTEEERRGAGEGMAEGVLYVKVMTDEQMEVLRRQISVYATICEQLVEMHKAVTAQQDSLAGGPPSPPLPLRLRKMRSNWLYLCQMSSFRAFSWERWDLLKSGGILGGACLDWIPF